MLYGATFVLVVAAVLPAEEFGVWSTFQVSWIAATQLGDNWILQPMVKLAAEDRSKMPPLVGSAIFMYIVFIAAISLLVWAASPLFGVIFHSTELGTVMPWIGPVLAANIIRNIAIRTLQVEYQIQRIFLLDILFFAVVIGMIISAAGQGMMRGPMDMVNVNIYGALASSALALVIGGRSLRSTLPRRAEIGRISRLGMYQAATGAMQIVQQQLDAVLLGLFRPQATVGFYTLAKTYFRGFEAIRDAANIIVLPAASELHAKGEDSALKRLVEAGGLLIAIIIIPAVAVSIAASDLIFGTIYHGAKDAAIPLFQVFNLGALAMPLTIIAGNVLLGIGETRPLYRITLVNMGLYLALFFVLTPLFGAVGAALALTVTSFAYAYSTLRGVQQFIPVSIAGMMHHWKDFMSVVRRKGT
jgi:O-antigen/teichoic acid export membrane protein